MSEVIDRDALKAVIAATIDECAKGSTHSSDEFDRRITDAVIAHLSAQPTGGEVEWEYGWSTGSTFTVIGSRADTEQWLAQFDAKLGVGDWGGRVRRRRSAGPWIEVQS